MENNIEGSDKWKLWWTMKDAEVVNYCDGDFETLWKAYVKMEDNKNVSFAKIVKYLKEEPFGEGYCYGYKKNKIPNHRLNWINDLIFTQNRLLKYENIFELLGVGNRRESYSDADKVISYVVGNEIKKIRLKAKGLLEIEKDDLWEIKTLKDIKDVKDLQGNNYND